MQSVVSQAPAEAGVDLSLCADHGVSGFCQAGADLPWHSAVSWDMDGWGPLGKSSSLLDA